ncbi:MAG TPA: PAS domain-containing protein, partial [Thermoanaerobaculia bacterium]|nr:PAS domain-containing protein [Thermoanaerobaculia bacterium]
SFRPVDLKHRVFARTPNSNMRDRLLALQVGSAAESGATVRNVRLREAAFDAAATAQIVLDRRGHVVMINEKARRLFNLGVSEVGRLFQDLEVSYRPVELRSHIEAAHHQRNAVQLTDVEVRAPNGEQRQLEVHIVPLLEAGGGSAGTSVSFLDHTQAHLLRNEVEKTHQELETAYEELQSANEELETTNEELQSTIEELETTNEELQSANEELETMNEELQSTNEELRTLNDQIQHRSEELNHVNRYLKTILSSLRAAVVVLDRRLQVKVWSEKAEDLWGLRSDEVQGQPLLELDIGLPVRKLEEPLQQCLAGPVSLDVEIDGVNRRGRPIRCGIRCTPLLGRGVEGVILIIEELAA